jgi:hypothetical protein
MVHWFPGDGTGDDEAAIREFMTRVAKEPAPPDSLPDADVMWLKSQLLRRWETERKVVAPLDLMEPIQIAAGLVAAALLLAWSLPSLLRLLPTSLL